MILLWILSISESEKLYPRLPLTSSVWISKQSRERTMQRTSMLESTRELLICVRKVWNYRQKPHNNYTHTDGRQIKVKTKNHVVVRCRVTTSHQDSFNDWSRLYKPVKLFWWQWRVLPNRVNGLCPQQGHDAVVVHWSAQTCVSITCDMGFKKTGAACLKYKTISGEQIRSSIPNFLVGSLERRYPWTGRRMRYKRPSSTRRHRWNSPWPSVWYWGRKCNTLFFPLCFWIEPSKIRS